MNDCKNVSKLPLYTSSFQIIHSLYYNQFSNLEKVGIEYYYICKRESSGMQTHISVQ